MKFGQTPCSARVPNCLICPVRQFCRAADPESLPTKIAARAAEKVDEHAARFWRSG
ncbi:MAG: hypothetical protein R3F11_22790 [Verrucomicrobiales bacterium]